MNLFHLRVIFGAVAVLIVPSAQAGCGDIATLVQSPFEFARTDSAAPITLDEAAIRGALDPNNVSATLTGTWSFEFAASGNTGHTPPIPDGVLVDFGYAQFNGDGNEMMNSGGRSPASENFCMGVWQKTDTNQYMVNHFALSYDPVSGMLNAKVNIREILTLSPGGTKYSGTFTIDVYDPKGLQRVDHVAGTVTGTRINLDSTLP
jgi:hypothetical protein